MRRVMAELMRKEEEKLRAYAQRDLELQERLRRKTEEQAMEDLLTLV